MGSNVDKDQGSSLDLGSSF